MKVVILAGGRGTRLSEETDVKPKPMVEIGGMPILWHIMKSYAHYGFNEFIICLGYKGYVIKEFFANYFLHKSDVTIDLVNNAFTYHDSTVEPWKISLIDTGIHSMTGGRLKRIKKYINNQPFLLTYGDGLSDVNIHDVIKAHQANKKHCTVTAVKPQSRFGSINLNEDNVVGFAEKPASAAAWINGGFFVCEPQVLDFIQDDHTVWEQYPLETLAETGQLHAYKHEGFWKPMDTLRDKIELETAWNNNKALWKKW